MIHPTACVSAGAELGQNVAVGPFCVVEAGARIGDGTRLAAHVTVFGGVTIGGDCRLHPCAVIGDEPQDHGYRNQPSFVRIGDRCVIREGVTVHRGTQEGSETRVGNDCFLMANSHVAHNVVVEDGVILANGALLAGHVHVGAYAFISGNCAIHQFCRVGTRAMMGGLSVLTQDLPPFMTLRTGALNTVVGTNVVGMRRGGMDAEARRAVKRAYDLLYRSEMTPQ
jgi:UDP-N-acetylglucosamine acyltransferase